MRLLFIENYSYPLVVAGPPDLLHDSDPSAKILLERQIDHCTLDPGGMLCMVTPYLDVRVDDFEFGIKADQIEAMLDLWGRARVEKGHALISMWMQTLLIPETTYQKLQLFLQETHKSDIAIHAELTRGELLMKLEEAGIIVRKKLF